MNIQRAGTTSLSDLLRLITNTSSEISSKPSAPVQQSVSRVSDNEATEELTGSGDALVPQSRPGESMPDRDRSVVEATEEPTDSGDALVPQSRRTEPTSDEV